MTSSNENLKPWRQQITLTAVACGCTTDVRPVFGTAAVELCATFYFDRPKSQTKRERLQPFKATKPDLDKTLRAVLDSLTGIAYMDDAQVARVVAEKRFGSPARVEIMVRPCA